MSRRGRLEPGPERDQERSIFTTILEHLLDATPAGLAAVLVDYDGETVDYAGAVDPFDLKVAAAHWQIVLSEVRGISALGQVRGLVVAARARSYFLRAMHEGYAVMLIVHRSAAFSVSERALQDASARFAREAGWPPPPDAARWFHVDVEATPTDRTRPAKVRVAGAWQPVEVMGSMVGLRAREKGYRVRLPSGVEMILVRERMGRWFCDEQPDQARRAGA
jgi:hypothetical protein